MKHLMLALLLSQAADTEMARIDEWAKGQPENGPGRIGVGDEYFKAVRKFPKERSRFMDKANEWWAKGWPDLDAIWKMKARERLSKVYAAATPAPERKLPVTGWTAIGGAKADSLRVRTGSSALHLKIARKDGGLADIGGSESFDVIAGTEIEVTAWVLTDGTDGSEDKFGFVLYDAKGKSLATKELLASKDTPVWTKLSEKFELPKGAVRGKFGILISSKVGDIWYDDFSVKVDGKEQLPNGSFER